MTAVEEAASTARPRLGVLGLLFVSRYPVL